MTDTETLLTIYTGVERRLAARRSLQTGEAFKDIGYVYDTATNQWQAPAVLARSAGVVGAAGNRPGHPALAATAHPQGS